MNCDSCAQTKRQPTRRELLWEIGGGLAGIALASLLADEAAADNPKSNIQDPKSPHTSPKAKQVIFIHLPGGLSHVDSFDFKPGLAKHHGTEVQGRNTIVAFNGKRGTVLKSPWEFRPYGKYGKMVSDLVPHLGACADDVTFIHSMVSKSNAHGPALF